LLLLLFFILSVAINSSTDSFKFPGASSTSARTTLRCSWPSCAGCLPYCPSPASFAC
jgi:hypothetical protein